jgi:PKD repeat protein
MKKLIHLSLVVIFSTTPTLLNAQEKAINPALVINGVYYGETPPLRDLPTLTEAEWQAMAGKAERKMLNPKLRTRSYPFSEIALPKGNDPVWQSSMVTGRDSRAPIQNFNGQDSPYFPPDANGTVGPNHYMQTINTVYSIYNKSGTLVAGPTAMNLLFSGITGSEYNDGDPIVLYDEQADRWLAAEFSISGSNDYMLIAVSTTNDPTGTWHKYSFDVADMPDYEKFGIWQDGYYMGTNNSVGNDIYVFERSKMLIGQTAQAVGFNNPWRPTTIDGFMCVPPLDNDGAFAPAGEPGLFITLNDDAIGGGSDQLWIYELDVDWVTPAISTFTRTQQLNVAAFDSNFGANWDNIKQPGTTRELDAIPQVIMNPPQYRNFGTYETIVCCHTVDVDNTDHAGIRWYELRRVASGNWTIRQQGTYAPDGHSRWMGSIMLNGQNEIALGYSISSTSVYPGIRYCGQSASAYAAASSTMDIAEEIIQTGAYSQTAYNRWGDYSALQVDPIDDHTFWFTTQYIGSGGARKTKIAAFTFTAPPLTAAFTGNPTTVCSGGQVAYTDQSFGGPVSWNWTFPGGTPAASNIQNPTVTYSSPGVYNVSLTVGNGSTNNTLTKTGYITVINIIADFTATPTSVNAGNTVAFTDNSLCSPSSWSWTFPGGTPSSSSSQNPVITYNTAGVYSVTLTATNPSGSDSETKTNYITVVNCSNLTLPFQEVFSGGSLPNCWSIVDNQGNGQVWQFNNPGNRTINTSTASNGFAILDSDLYGVGNSQNADLVTPSLNLSTYTTVNVQFQHYYYHYTGSSANLSYSINGGNTWTTIQTWTTSTANATNFSQDMTAQLAGQANVKIRWKYTGTWGFYWAVDDISITGTGPNTWTGAISSNWNLPSNWSNNIVPTGSTPAFISSSASNWPAFSGDLTIGADCSDLTLYPGAQMSIAGNLIINPGRSLIFSQAGELSIDGNWTNSGNFSPGQGTIRFTGSSASNVTKNANTSDITSYTRTVFTKGMTNLSGPTTGPTGDNGNSLAPLGFTFNYLGTNYTQARLSTNGWMSLNQSGTTQSDNNNLFSSSNPNTTLAPWFDDLTVDASGLLSYKTEGVSPNRVFTAEWKNVPTFRNQATARINFQVKLYETSNIIEFHYGSLVDGTHSSNESASIGIEDATGGPNHFIEATTGSTTAGVTTLKSANNWPVINYRFAPPEAAEVFNHVIINKSGSNVDFNTGTTVNGTFTVMPGSTFNVKNGKTISLTGNN